MHTSNVHVSSVSNCTIGCPPTSISVLFCGRNRATTLIEFDMIASVDVPYPGTIICTREKGRESSVRNVGEVVDTCSRKVIFRVPARDGNCCAMRSRYITGNACRHRFWHLWTIHSHGNLEGKKRVSCQRPRWKI